MPYIGQGDRKKWDNVINETGVMIQQIPPEKLEGELNYFITSILNKNYKPGYYNYNRVIGLLECIKMEFYRRSVAEYEQKKIKENGDV